MQAFTNIYFFPHGRTSKIIFPSPRNPPYLRKRKQNKEAVVNARKLLQYCQFADKKILAVFPGTFEISRYLKIFIYHSTRSCETSSCVLRNPVGKPWVVPCVVQTLCKLMVQSLNTYPEIHNCKLTELRVNARGPKRNTKYAWAEHEYER